MSDKEKRMPLTVKPKTVIIDDVAYHKCPHPDCDHMARDRGYVSSELRLYTFPSDDDIYAHVRNVHGYKWMTVGKRTGWWRLHSKPKEE